jgi:membrane fusion protein (multidrug efflux system)
MILAAAAPSLFLLTASCDGSPEAAGEADEPPARQERAVRVDTWIIESTGFEERLELTASLEAWDEIDLSSEFGGLVREVLFEKGDFVRSGEVLARIGDDLAGAQLDQARAGLADAEAVYDKTLKLFEREAVPKQDMDTAIAQRDRMRAQVRERELVLERSSLRAPIDGFARDRHVDPGEVLAPGSPVTTLQRIDRLKVVASVPDTEISWLRVGSAGIVQVDAWPGRQFRATVHFLSPSADPTSRTFPIELELPNAGLDLRPGMVARLELSKRKLVDAVAVPMDALVTRLEGRVAFVVEDCHAVMRPVAVTSTEGDRVLIESGLAAGEELVVKGQRDLADGQRVDSEACR